jgi:glycerol-3-phosphate dehydrogenase (NAD(P)+)
LGGLLELDLLEAMATSGENARYLPGISFPANLVAEPSLEDCLDDEGDVLVAVPSHGLRDTLMSIRPLLGPRSRVCWATKGFELHTGKLPHQVAAEVLGADRPIAVLSGPTFAKEVAAGLPTAMTIAANDNDFAEALAVTLSSDTFRAYTSDDIIGVEVGGGWVSRWAQARKHLWGWLEWVTSC